MEKLQNFINLLQKEQQDGIIKQGYDWEIHKNSYTISSKSGKKYTKVNVGNSGKYMIDKQGNIFGIKGYGQIHLGHHYGTLDTINNWDWSGYTAVKK